MTAKQYQQERTDLLTPDLLNQLILSIYQGVMEDEPWGNFLSHLNHFLHCDSSAVLLVSPGAQPGEKYLLNRVLSTNSELRPMSPKWLAVDPFETIPDNTPVLLDDLNQESPIENTELFRELVQPSGLRYVLGINVIAKTTPDLVFKLRAARKKERGNFSGAETELFVTLTGHLQLALDFFDKKAVRQVERNAYADVVNQFMLGTLVVDEAGRIIGSNKVARDTIERYPFLQIQEGRLVIGIKKVHQQFCEALARIDQSSASGSQKSQRQLPITVTIPLENAQTLGLMIREIRQEDNFSHPVHSHAVVFISDPQGMQEIAPETLQELFGFTGKEAKVAAYLANGYSLNEAADALSISINTAKSHARNIYDKTGVNKQTKFIQLVSNSVARVS